MRGSVTIGDANLEAAGLRSAGASDQLLRSREGFATVYAELGPGRADRDSRTVARERALVLSSMEAGLSTDSFEPRFGRDLAARLKAVSTTATDGTARAYLQVAVPGFGLEPWEVEGRVHYPMRLRFVAIDPDGVVRAELDTVLVQEFDRTIRPDRYLQDVVSLPVPANASLRYRLALFVGQQSGSVSAVESAAGKPFRPRARPSSQSR
jgi:hypothetical protein